MFRASVRARGCVCVYVCVCLCLSVCVCLCMFWHVASSGHYYLFSWDGSVEGILARGSWGVGCFAC